MSTGSSKANKSF
jgi:hypothetical protein